LLNALFQHARAVARRVRTETGIAHGHVSVSSAAVDYVRAVFDHFGDKTVLVIGAGKMGELTLRHLKQLRPKHILVTNRGPAEAIGEQEAKRFLKEWARRRNGPVISSLQQYFEAKCAEELKELFAHLNGKLSEADRERIKKAFSRLQNQVLHGPISALAEE